MQEHLIELRIGETLQVGQIKVTVIDVDGDELCVQIDGYDGDDFSSDGLSLNDLLEMAI